ncbi:MAG TPA: hypothetical protein VGI98_02080 [Candidatus Limnocylindrales bacterium]
MRRSPLVSLLAAACLSVAACSQATPAPSVIVVGTVPPGGIVPVVVNQEFGVGPNHLVMTVLDEANVPIAAPDRQATISLVPPTGGQGGGQSTMTFEWGITGSVGFYILDTDLPTAGTWQATLTLAAPTGSPATSASAAASGVATTGPASATVSFDVKAKTSAVAIGQPAPSVKTPTAADVGGDLKQISTDPTPDPHFYATSEDAALAAHKPFVLVFATPAFCQSATCGPALDHVKSLFPLYPDVTFIHVEPYQMTFTDGRLQPTGGQLTSNAITNAWGILSEPWVYVVDKTGIVRASFPSVFSDAEFKAAIDAVR